MDRITLVVDSMSMIDKLDFDAIQKKTGYAREDINFITREEYKELQRKELAELKEYANENGERLVKEHLKEVAEGAAEEFLKKHQEYLVGNYDAGFRKSHSSKSYCNVKHKTRSQKNKQKKANKKAKRNNH